MIGIQVTKQDLNIKAGNIALGLNELYNQAVEIKQFIDLVGTEGLIGAGFTEDEAATMKTAFEDLAYQKQESFDSSQAVKQLYGLGVKV
jgi:hypothetical protein